MEVDVGVSGSLFGSGEVDVSNIVENAGENAVSLIFVFKFKGKDVDFEYPVVSSSTTVETMLTIFLLQ